MCRDNVLFFIWEEELDISALTGDVKWKHGGGNR